MVPSPNDYIQCAEDAGRQLERGLGENFVSFFVIGSLAQDDVAPGWSDIDAVLVVDKIDETVEDMIDSLREDMARKYEFLRSERGSKLGIFPLSYDDLVDCRVSSGGFPSALNFHDFRFNSRTFSGQDLSRRIEVLEVTEEDVALILSGYRDLLVREANSSAYWKGRNAIISVLNVARLTLMMQGTIVTKKREILEASDEASPVDREIVDRAVHLRENWMEAKGDDESLERIYGDALRLFEEQSFF
jgi:hypothetical protein